MKFPDILFIPITIMSIFIVLTITFELWNLILNSYKIIYISRLINKRELNLPTYNKKLLEDEKKIRKYVLFNNLLCDVTFVLNYHPGGKNLIEDNLYLDIGRYITGTQAYNNSIKAHNHNFYSYAHLINRLAYAQFKDDNLIIRNNNITYYLETSDLSNVRLIDKRTIALDTVEFKFTLNNNIMNTMSDNKTILFSTFLTGHLWLGRHFAVSSKRLNKTRYYSICLSLNQNIYDKYLEMIDNVKSNELIEANSESINSLNKIKPPKFDLTSETYSLYIKRYNYKDALSNHIHNLEKNTEIDLIINGPVGIGLNLEPRLNGTHIAFVGGTGIFPFIDFIALVLRYSISKINKSNIVHKEDFSYIDDDFKLIVFASFRNEESCVFTDICERLEEMDLKYGLKLFRFFLKISDSGFEPNNKKWDPQFIKDNLYEYGDHIKKIMISGPVGFMEFVKDSIINSKVVNKEKLHFV
jgi:ferredoxin-NADP reductase